MFTSFAALKKLISISTTHLLLKVALIDPDDHQ